MALITDGLAEITLLSSLEGQEIENIFYYWDITNTPISNMSGIVTQWDANIMASLATPTSNAVSFVNLKIRDVKGTNPDFDLAPTQATGISGGDVLPAFNAVRIDLIGQTKLTGRGYKRFAGLPEASTTGNEITAAAKVNWNSLASTLNNAVTVGADTYFAIIFGKPTPTAPTRSESNLILSALVRDIITSQVSRKP